MGEILTVRAREAESLRGKNRELRRLLAEREEIIRENDAMVSLQHRLALLLLARKDGRRKDAETLLRRGLNASECAVIVFSKQHASLAAQTAKLPPCGRALDAPMRGEAVAGALYYHLPLKRGRRALGLVILKFKPKTRFREGGGELCGRLAELLAAAL